MARKKWKKKEWLERKEEIVEKEEQKEHNRIVLIGVLVLLLVAGYYFFGQGYAPTSTSPPPSKNIKGNYILISDMPSTHVPGKVTLVEFFDFYCPHCYRFHIERWPVLKERFGDKIELVDYGYPLRQRSIPPIEAYEIARGLGKGEEMKDAMFFAIHEEQKDISNVEALATIAESVSLDREAFTKAFNVHGMTPKVNENIRLGNSYRLDSTPTFIIDGNIKTIDSSVANLEMIIDSVLEGE